MTKIWWLFLGHMMLYTRRIFISIKPLVRWHWVKLQIGKYVSRPTTRIKINKLILCLFWLSAGLGCKQQDLLLSSFIKRIYAEIAKNHPPPPPPKSEARKNPQPQQDTPIPTVERKRQPAPKKTMSTMEALAELEKFCRLEDPHNVYTNMVKIGEGLDDNFYV